MQRAKALTVYKQLYRNLRVSKNATGVELLKNIPNTKEAREEPYVEILRNEFRQHLVSDSKYCMQKDEMFFMANTLSTYLNSTKQTLELYAKYCRGERSIEEAANIVGLKLPKQYEGPSTVNK